MQDPYPATFQRRHHNISLGAVFFCLHVNNNLSKWRLGHSSNYFLVGNDTSGSKLYLATGQNYNDFYQLYADEDYLRFGKQSGGNWTECWSAALKSDLASVDITPTPISGLAFAPATMFKKAGVAYLNLQISNTTSSAISMENGKVIATGLPIPYKKQQVYVEAIPWNNGTTGSNASTTPLRLCINNTGQLCSYYPSANEKITPGMPICINMAYPINE